MNKKPLVCLRQSVHIDGVSQSRITAVVRHGTLKTTGLPHDLPSGNRFKANAGELRPMPRHLEKRRLS